MASSAFDLDAAVVGAGPAGMAAALALAAAGQRVAVFDEQPRPGGQLLRQPPYGFEVANWLPVGPTKNKSTGCAAPRRKPVSIGDWAPPCGVPFATARELGSICISLRASAPSA